MPNIFDGYENKSPKELAEKLGISESSIVKNSRKEASKTLESTNSGNSNESNFNPFLGLYSSEIKDKDKWKSIEWWRDFEIGMRIKKIAIGKIIQIQKPNDHYSNTTITIGFEDGSSKEIDDFNDSIKDISVYSDDLEPIEPFGQKTIESIDRYWIDKYSIEELKRNMRIRKTSENLEIGNILDIDIYNNKIQINIKGHGKYTLDFTSFQVMYTIYREDFIENKIRKLESKGKWVDDYSMNDLDTNKYLLGKHGNLMTIREIDGEDIHLQDETQGNDIILVENFEDLKEFYKLYTPFNDKKEKVNQFLGIKEKYIGNDDLWEESFEEDELRIGMRVRFYSGKIGKILINEWNEITIEYEDHSTESFDTFDQFKMVYGIYKTDVKTADDIDYLDQEYRTSDSYWKTIQKPTELKPGMRIRDADKGVVVEGEILEIIDTTITIMFYNVGIIVVSWKEFKAIGYDIYNTDYLTHNF